MTKVRTSPFALSEVHFGDDELFLFFRICHSAEHDFCFCNLFPLSSGQVVLMANQCSLLMCKLHVGQRGVWRRHGVDEPSGSCLHEEGPSHAKVKIVGVMTSSSGKWQIGLSLQQACAPVSSRGGVSSPSQVWISSPARLSHPATRGDPPGGEGRRPGQLQQGSAPCG